MIPRLCIALLACCLALPAQSLSVQQLVNFLRSAVKTSTDKELSNYLAKVKMTERLDDRTIEELQGAGIGPRTIQALQKLKADSAGLAAAATAPVVTPPPPKPIPPPSSEEQAEIITAVRKYALDYSKNLPDFICAQVTKRKIAPLPGGKYGQYASKSGTPAWQTIDTLTIRLSYFEQKENYKVLLRNNTPMTQDYQQLGGPKAFGDFGSLMRELFEPSTQARFEWDHWATLRGKRAMAFSYRVSQLNSKYQLTVEDLKLSITTAYRGLVFVDPKTRQILRVTTVAFDIPADFPIRSAETTLDYDYQDLSGRPFLLPLKANILLGGVDTVNAIEEDFRLYRKYSAESELKFDTEPLPPEPAETKTK